MGSSIAAAEPLIQATLLGEAVDTAPVAVFVADDELRYVAVSHFAAEMLGYTREELLALRVTDVARDERAADAYAEVLEGGTAEGKTTLTRKDGTTFEFRYVAAETRVGGIPLFVSVGVADD